ncbi:glutathione S-transferase [Artomyces pyxidatus]|uniref:Glutathione S-transferase n=1 Tax=Artomyces pyxidatus TaxID=48021 RepID=A0ACB8T2L2_9AGAM|nr:glutathione S-transferase [Artomyces pyxidatus]
MATEQITLYSSKACPFCQRVELAISEAGANINRYEIDLSNKPDWYASKISSSGKVPSLAYGGPKVSPDLPSPESTKIAESLILLEFVADLYPDAHLLPGAPIERAQVRFFIDAVSTKVLPAYAGFVMRGEPKEKLFGVLEDAQALLSPAGFAVGNSWTIADAAIAPFLGRLDLMLGNDVGKFEEGVGRAAHAEIFEGDRFARLQKYYKDLTGRKSWKATFDGEYILDNSRARFARAA